MFSEPLYITDSSGSIREAGSVNEYNFAIALEKEEIPFLYQFSLFGGHLMAGGIAVDFLAWAPFAVPIEIVGAYWHRNSSKERYRSALITQYFNREPLEVTEEQSETVGDARAFIKREIK